MFDNGGGAADGPGRLAACSREWPNSTVDSHRPLGLGAIAYVQIHARKARPTATAITGPPHDLRNRTLSRKAFGIRGFHKPSDTGGEFDVRRMFQSESSWINPDGAVQASLGAARTSHGWQD